MEPTTQSPKPAPDEATMDDLSADALRRITEMESPDYVFPEPFSRADWIAALLVIVAMTAWIIIGYWM